MDRPASPSLEKFRLYQTLSKYYMTGRDKKKTVWRVLEIDRLETSEHIIHENPSVYSEGELNDLMNRINEETRQTGGLKFVTKCYGIVGFVRFLGPHYILLITDRRQVGVICGQAVYAIARSKMIQLQNSTVQPNKAYSKDENRYKKLLLTMDLTKDFFFSYSYHIMCSLQKNLSDGKTGHVLYETMFVWNEFLTRGIRNHLKNTMWTVALIYGFFKQAKFSVHGKDFTLTLIARRSRHFAGTRYLKRGANEKGRVANDVETEQIVVEDSLGTKPTQITSVVQNRGSIPLFWSQESSWLNIKPDIILHEDQKYEATRLHFDNLVDRYGNPIIILNLTKQHERRPRESILSTNFARAIDYLNENLSKYNYLEFLPFDIHYLCQRWGSAKMFKFLKKVMAFTLHFTGFFYCELPIASRLHDDLNRMDNSPLYLYNNHHRGIIEAAFDSQEDEMISVIPQNESLEHKTEIDKKYLAKEPIFQKGVLRTNCIDCLDRTNVAQFAYGLTTLGHQLCALGFIDDPEIKICTPLADDLMLLYESMGDTLALQYGGSGAHNKIFSDLKGQWKPATQSQEIFRTLQRYYNNAYMDVAKQDAINVFLGHFQPKEGKPALWEIDSDQHYNERRQGHSSNENARSFIQRSLSDGNIVFEGSCSVEERKVPESEVHEKMGQSGDINGLCGSVSEIIPSESNISYSRYARRLPGSHLFADCEHSYSNELRFDVSNHSNSLDLDWNPYSTNSSEEEVYDRFPGIVSSVGDLSIGTVISGTTSETGINISDNSIKGMEATDMALSYNSAQRSDVSEFSENFVKWVLHEENSLLFT